MNALHLWRKEILGELYTWKSMLWLVMASLIFSVMSYLFLTNTELSLLDQTELMWLFAKVVIGTALLIVAIDASSVITTEFERETAESLFLAPLSVRDFLLGKFLAVMTLWAALYAVSIPYIIVISTGSHLTIAFLAHIALQGTFIVSAFALLIFALSLLVRSGKNTLTTSLVLLFALGMPASFATTLAHNPAASAFALVNPLGNVFSSLDNVLVDYHASLLANWQYLLPVIIFLFATLAFLYASARRLRARGIIASN